MSNATLRGKLDRLRRDLGPIARDGEPCRAMHLGGIVAYCPELGDPEPVISEADYPACQTCGQVHVLVEEIVIVPGDGTPSQEVAR
jgi:hypothetical protein